MRAPIAVLLLLAACVDFDLARAQCDLPGRRCAASTGDGGADVDAGWCSGCVVGSTCLAPPLNDSDRTCALAGTACVDCTLYSQSCRHYACVTQRTWKQKYRASIGGALRAVWVGDGGEVWAAGDDSTLIHSAGSGTFDEYFIGGNAVYDLTTMVVDGHPALAAVGTNGPFGAVTVLPLPWTDQGSPPGFSHTVFTETKTVYSAFHAGGSLLVAGGKASGHVPFVRRFEDGGWLDVTPSAGWGMVVGAWGAPAGEYYAITDNLLLSRVSTQASVQSWAIPTLALGVWGGSSSSVWLAGTSGYIAHFEGGGFTRYDAGVEFLWAGTWASDDDHVFLAGENGQAAGAIAEWDGVVWRTSEPATASTAFSAVHGVSPEELWAVDLNGALWHFEP